MNLKDHIRGVPDFPKPGILFYDISTLLRNADAWRALKVADFCLPLRSRSNSAAGS
jgi:adenine/guanine phosphoribosyltransferase-like PRPP-binding protein